MIAKLDDDGIMMDTKTVLLSTLVFVYMNIKMFPQEP